MSGHMHVAGPLRTGLLTKQISGGSPCSLHGSNSRRLLSFILAILVFFTASSSGSGGGMGCLFSSSRVSFSM